MDTSTFIKQLEGILQDYKALAARSQHNDLSDLPKNDRQALITRGMAAIRRISGDASPYAKDAERLVKDHPALHVHSSSVIGVVQALLDDVRAGYLTSLVELVHADLFADFLEMAQHLLDTGYKDAAAVIAGSALESHLRALCLKSGIPAESTKTDGTIVPKKADALNAELASGGVYSRLDQKNVTAWLDLRNKAAHGKYSEYNKDQVVLMIAAVRDFLGRNSA